MKPECRCGRTWPGGEWPHLLAQLLGRPQAASRSAQLSLRDSSSPPRPCPSLVTVSYPYSPSNNKGLQTGEDAEQGPSVWRPGPCPGWVPVNWLKPILSAHVETPGTCQLCDCWHVELNPTVFTPGSKGALYLSVLCGPFPTIRCRVGQSTPLYRWEDGVVLVSERDLHPKSSRQPGTVAVTTVPLMEGRWCPGKRMGSMSRWGGSWELTGAR